MKAFLVNWNLTKTHDIKREKIIRLNCNSPSIKLNIQALVIAMMNNVE